MEQTVQTTAQATPATQPQLKTSYLVEVRSRTTAWATSFRWYTPRQANRCAKDFPHANVTITPQQGRMTFEGWVTMPVQGGAA